MQSVPMKPLTGELGDNDIIAFDFESFATDEHVVNEAHWQHLQSGETGCMTGEHALRDFARFVYTRKNTIFVAHNGRGYDFPLLSRALLAEYGIYPKKIHNGSKIMRMGIKSNVFVDSLSHIAGALASFPKTFGLGINVRKGYYPYMFDTPETQGYIVDIPEARHFVPSNMSTAGRHDFEEWHLQQVVAGKRAASHGTGATSPALGYHA